MFVWIVFEVLRAELVLAQDIRFAVGILVEGVVFEIVLDLVCFRIDIVLLTAIGGIRHHFLWQPLQSLAHPVQVGNETVGVPCSVMDTVAHNELSLCARLDI